jgi:hypothetical protein
VNPDPVTVAVLIVTAAVPVEVMVTDWVVGVFRLTVPNATLLLAMVSVGVEALRVRAKVFATPPAVAVRLAV